MGMPSAPRSRKLFALVHWRGAEFASWLRWYEHARRATSKRRGWSQTLRSIAATVLPVAWTNHIFFWWLRE